jgi:hypothetical protein
MAQLSSDRYVRLSHGQPTYGQSDGLYWDKTNSQLVLVIAGAIVAKIDATGITADLEFSAEARGDILRRVASAWESYSAKTSGQFLIGNGTDVISAALSGAIASVSAAGAVVLAGDLIRVATGTITSADIVDTAANKLGHAQGYPLLAPVGAHNVPELVSCVLIHDYAGAAYGGGGDTTVNLSGGGAAQSNPVAKGDFAGAGSDKLVVLRPPTATAGVALVENAGLNLVVSTGAFTLGAATGVVRYALNYRVHATGLA